MLSGFRYFFRVRYGECDAQQVVFNARYGDYVDLATFEYVRAIGYDRLLIGRGLDYQVRKQTTEWYAPAKFDDVLEATVRPGHVGTTSFVLGVDLRIAGTPQVIATAETVYVVIDLGSRTKHPIPDEFRAGLGSGLAAVVDHAGWGERAAQAA
ncbi:MAG: acyl-CoA thioesterase [Nevskia sp.]|nr:acyl-CoA thioesterase [Nevskia sp.]